MLAHDFGNGVALVWLLRLLCIIMLDCCFRQKFP